jgi:hypothetical protein
MGDFIYSCIKEGNCQIMYEGRCNGASMMACKIEGYSSFMARKIIEEINTTTEDIKRRAGL